jgi:hypothetical protein
MHLRLRLDGRVADDDVRLAKARKAGYRTTGAGRQGGIRQRHLRVGGGIVLVGVEVCAPKWLKSRQPAAQETIANDVRDTAPRDERSTEPANTQSEAT